MILLISFVCAVLLITVIVSLSSDLNNWNTRRNQKLGKEANRLRFDRQVQKLEKEQAAGIYRDINGSIV